jgi:hypothetical protein
MLETHTVMSLLIFCPILILVLRLILLHVLCLASFVDLTITHMVLIHERITLYLDALVTSYVLIVVIISPRMHDFPAGGFYIHCEYRHLDDPSFPRHGSRSTGSKGEVQKTVKTSSGRMIKCWIPKIYLTNPSTEPSTSSHPM